MSIITDLKTKVSGAPAPADLSFMLSQAQDVLDHLQEDYGAAALGAVDNPAGQKALDQIKTQIASARDRVELLTAALVASEKQAQELIRAQRKSLQKSQFLAACKHLDLVNGAAADYATAIAAAATAYRSMHLHLRKAQAACPLAMAWPLEALSENDLIRLSAGESYRHVAQAGAGRFANSDSLALPGAAFSDTAYKDDPTAMPPIAETIRKNGDEVKSYFKSKLLP